MLTVVPVNISTIHHASPLARRRYAYHAYYPYYHPYPPVPVMQFQVLRLMVSVYSVAGREPLWQGLSETVDPGQDLPERLASTVVTGLVRGGLVYPQPTETVD